MGYETKAAAVVTAADAAAQLDGAGAEALRGELDALRMELKQDLDGLSRRLVSAPPVMGGAMATRSTAFGDAYLRNGMEAGFESKRMSVGVGGEGGLAVPLEIDQRIETTLKQISPIRALADVVKIGSANYRKLVASGGFASGWVAETADAGVVRYMPPSTAGSGGPSPGAARHRPPLRRFRDRP